MSRRLVVVRVECVAAPDEEQRIPVRIPQLDALLDVPERSGRSLEIRCEGLIAGTRNLVAQLVVAVPEMLVGRQDLQGSAGIGRLTKLQCLIDEPFRSGGVSSIETDVIRGTGRRRKCLGTVRESVRRRDRWVGCTGCEPNEREQNGSDSTTFHDCTLRLVP